MKKKQPLSREEMKEKRKAMLTPRVDKPEFFFIGKADKTGEIFSDSIHADNKDEAIQKIQMAYMADLIKVRKGKAFSEREIANIEKKCKR